MIDVVRFLWVISAEAGFSLTATGNLLGFVSTNADKKILQKQKIICGLN